MNCLNTDQLARLALGDAPPEWNVHVQACAACSARLSEVEGVLRTTAEAHVTFGASHEAGRRRLMTSIQAEAHPPRPQTLFERIVMNRRNWIATATALAIVATAFFAWDWRNPTIALADAIKTVKEAKSFSAYIERPVPIAKDDQKAKAKITWAAPGSLRSDSIEEGKTLASAIVHKDKPGIAIDHKDKTFLPIDERKIGKQEAVILRVINDLSAYKVGDEKPAATEKIDGVKALRFDLVLNGREAKPGEWDHRVWVNPKTKRPIRVDFNILAGMKLPAGVEPIIYRLDKIEWDVPIDKLFDTTPPVGYKAGGK